MVDGLRFGSVRAVVGGEGHGVAVQSGGDGDGLIRRDAGDLVGVDVAVLFGIGQRFAIHCHSRSVLGVAGLQDDGEGAILSVGDGLAHGGGCAVVGGKGYVVGVDRGGDGDGLIRRDVGDLVGVDVAVLFGISQRCAVHGDDGSRLRVAGVQRDGEGAVLAVVDGLRFGSVRAVVGGKGHVIAVQRGGDGHGLVGGDVLDDVGEGEVILGRAGQRRAVHGDDGSRLRVAGLQGDGEGAGRAVVDGLRRGSVRAVVGSEGHVVGVDRGGDGDGLIRRDAGDLVGVDIAFIVKGLQRLAAHGDHGSGLGVALVQRDGELTVLPVGDRLRRGSVRAVVGGEGHGIGVDRGGDGDCLGFLDFRDHVVVRAVHHAGGGERFVVHGHGGSGLRVAGLGRDAEAEVFAVGDGGSVCRDGRAVVRGDGHRVGVLGGGDADGDVRGDVGDLIGVIRTVHGRGIQRGAVLGDHGRGLGVTLAELHGKGERLAVLGGVGGIVAGEALVADDGKGVGIDGQRHVHFHRAGHVGQRDGDDVALSRLAHGRVGGGDGGGGLVVRRVKRHGKGVAAVVLHGQRRARGGGAVADLIADLVGLGFPLGGQRHVAVTARQGGAGGKVARLGPVALVGGHLPTLEGVAGLALFGQCGFAFNGIGIHGLYAVHIKDHGVFHRGPLGGQGGAAVFVFHGRARGHNAARRPVAVGGRHLPAREAVARLFSGGQPCGIGGLITEGRYCFAVGGVKGDRIVVGGPLGVQRDIGRRRKGGAVDLVCFRAFAVRVPAIESISVPVRSGQRDGGRRPLGVQVDHVVVNGGEAADHLLVGVHRAAAVLIDRPAREGVGGNGMSVVSAVVILQGEGILALELIGGKRLALAEGIGLVGHGAGSSAVAVEPELIAVFRPLGRHGDVGGGGVVYARVINRSVVAGFPTRELIAGAGGAGQRDAGQRPVGVQREGTAGGQVADTLLVVVDLGAGSAGSPAVEGGGGGIAGLGGRAAVARVGDRVGAAERVGA